jgi:cytochrome P450/NADPH-cytochrome P450 reductase
MDRAEKIRGRQLTGAPHPDIRGLAKAILYVGCRTKGVYGIHAEELAEWERLGAVDVRWVYSRPAGDSLSGSSPHEGSDGADGSRWRRHVQDQIVHDREELAALLERGARIFVCGGTGVGQGVRQALKRIYLRQRRNGCRLRIDTDEGDPSRTADDEDAAAERFLEMLKTKERYATDVFT